MKNIAFVPFRSGSKRIVNKNIKLFNKKPLYLWTVEELYKNSSIDQIIINTDIGYLTEITKKICLLNIEDKVKIELRSYKNSLSIATSESVIMESIFHNKFNDDSNFIFCQVTNPFIQNKYINEGLLKMTEYNSVLSVVPQNRFSWKINNKKAIPVNYDIHNRKMDFNINTKHYIENGCFYINTIKNIKKDNCRLSGNIGLIKMPEYSYTEIDIIDDWVYAEYLHKKYILKRRLK